MALFAADAHVVVYMNAKDPALTLEFHSRDVLAPIIADLNKYDATTHFLGKSTILTRTSEAATGDAYGVAHHITVDEGRSRLMLASLRYLETFVKKDAEWLLAERKLYVDWREERSLS